MLQKQKRKHGQNRSQIIIQILNSALLEVVDHRVLWKSKGLEATLLDGFLINGHQSVKPRNCPEPISFSQPHWFEKNDNILKTQIFSFCLIGWITNTKKNNYVSQWLKIHYGVLSLKERQKEWITPIKADAAAKSNLAGGPKFNPLLFGQVLFVCILIKNGHFSHLLIFKYRLKNQ